MSRYVVPLLLVSVVIGACYGLSAFRTQDVLLRLSRQADPHDHDHEGEEAAENAMCPVTEHILAEHFTELAKELGLTGPDGIVCVIEDDHHEDNETEHGHEEEEHEDEHKLSFPLNLTCQNTFQFVKQLLVNLSLTSECCLENTTACAEEEDPGPVDISTRVAEAYGYGFLMVILVSACSLLGLFFVPFLKKGSKFEQFYKYFYTLMIALGASALFCDAILHLIPQAFGLHGHSAEEEAHDHEEEEDQTFIWKGVVIIVGTYFFFIFETILHTWNPHNHGLGSSHSSDDEEEKQLTKLSSTNANFDEEDPTESSSRTDLVHSGDGQNGSGNGEVLGSVCVEPTMPHGQCKDTLASSPAAILHPSEVAKGSKSEEKPSYSSNPLVRLYRYIRNIKPVAWLIIFGDAIHNFADGLALGAAIAGSLSVGISTMIAIILHEIPHELGDYVILLSTGMKWYIALLFNFVSALTAVIGFFVGVAISTSSDQATEWILAIAAGVFIYIALVDLLPELIHTKEKGWTRWALFLMANIGLIISFIALLLLAVYEDQLNSSVSL